MGPPTIEYFMLLFKTVQVVPVLGNIAKPEKSYGTASLICTPLNTTIGIGIVSFKVLIPLIMF